MPFRALWAASRNDRSGRLPESFHDPPGWMQSLIHAGVAMLHCARSPRRLSESRLAESLGLCHCGHCCQGTQGQPVIAAAWVVNQTALVSIRVSIETTNQRSTLLMLAPCGWETDTVPGWPITGDRITMANGHMATAELD